MNCVNAKKYLDAHVDGELEAGLMIEVENHLESCETCRSVAILKKRMKREIFALGERTKAPDHLRNKIVNISARRTRRNWILAASSLPLAAAAALLLMLTVGAEGLPPAGEEQVDEVVADVVQRHARELPVEVAGPDPRSASTWFRGKVDFPVQAPRLELQNASFQGARLSNVQSEQAAQMMYTVDGHKVTLMIFPARKLNVRGGDLHRVRGKDVVLGRRNGYNVAVMIDGDMAYALSSDLPSKRLLSLFTDLRI